MGQRVSAARDIQAMLDRETAAGRRGEIDEHGTGFPMIPS